MKKTVLITGSSSGIGREAVKTFQKNGWNVAATMRSPSKETELQNLPNVKLFTLDVTDIQSIHTTVADVIAAFGQLDAVVNNAGYGLVGPFEAATPEQIKRQFETNVFGLMNVTQAVIPVFRSQKSGTIIQVASVGGRITFPLYSLYHSTKWAVEGFSESLQYELEAFNIRMKIIEPGPIKTDFYDRSMDIMKRDGLTVYDAYVSRVMPNMMKAGATGSPASYTAGVIYEAASDGSKKIRYAAGGNAGGILFLRKLLPFRWFVNIVKMAVGH
jgi:NAD(P)-dependent dehydrogenase (short-subunit alcohol dehydrogenase family)